MSFLETSVQRNILGLVDEYGTKYPNIQERLDRLLISQYKESTNLRQYISDLLCVFEDIMQAAKEVITLRYIDSSYGAQMDVIGHIVGQARRLAGSKPLGYFGYYENPQSQTPSVGDDTNSLLGGILKGDFDPDSTDFVLTDPEFLKAIYAKILKNVSNTITDDVLQYVDLILAMPVDLEMIESETANAVHLRFHTTLSLTQKALVSTLIKAMKVGGVRYTMEDDQGEIDINFDGIAIIS